MVFTISRDGLTNLTQVNIVFCNTLLSLLLIKFRIILLPKVARPSSGTLPAYSVVRQSGLQSFLKVRSP